MDEFLDPIDYDDPANIETLVITVETVAFPVLMADGFGQIRVTLKPGESELVTLPNGKRIWVRREYLQ